MAILFCTTGRLGGHFTLNLILCANISLSTITNNWLRISRAQGCHKPTLVLHFHLRYVSDDGFQRRIHPALHYLHHLQTFAETQSGTQVYLPSGAGVLHFIHSFYWASCTLRWQHMKGNSVICQMYSVTWFSRYWWEAIWNITREYKVFPADCRINKSGGSVRMKSG